MQDQGDKDEKSKPNGKKQQLGQQCNKGKTGECGKQKEGYYKSDKGAGESTS